MSQLANQQPPLEPLSIEVPLRAPNWRRPLVLFLLTIISTYYCGGREMQLEVIQDPETGIWKEVANPALFVTGGFTYSVCVMMILIAHEMGHYLQSRRYGIQASLPYFIPMPLSPFGTMGACIVMEGNRADRKQMFDIAITGPLAGLVIALPMVVWGVLTVPELPLITNTAGSTVGTPLFLDWCFMLLRGSAAKGNAYYFNAPLFAGWFGIFMTSLNLLPVGQLDGGHLLHCLIPKYSRPAARLVFAILVNTVFFGILFLSSHFMGWLLILLLIRIMGVEHPPTTDDECPLGWTRILLGWLTLAFLIIGFTPLPFG